MSVPTIIVVVRLEDTPRVVFDVDSASAECRIASWGRTQADAISRAVDEALNRSERRCAGYIAGDLRRAA